MSFYSFLESSEGGEQCARCTVTGSLFQIYGRGMIKDLKSGVGERDEG